ASEPPTRPGTFNRQTKDDVQTPAVVQSSTSKIDTRHLKSSATPAEKKTVDKPMLRYAGKSFDEWRDVLLTDLDPSTRIKAFKALQAFGSTMHAQEVADAVQEALKTDQPDLNDSSV